MQHSITVKRRYVNEISKPQTHPERGMFTWQRDDYMEAKDAAQREGNELPEESDGRALFQNAAAYFEVAKKKSA